MSDTARRDPKTLDGTVLDRLFTVIESRQDADPDSSYTASLLRGGSARAAQKLGEEAIETVIAATGGNPEDLTAESADLLYHLLVLWQAAGIRPTSVWAALASREGVSGLAEKAARRT